MKYMIINMENIEKELTNTALEIAKRLGIEVNKDLVSIVDDVEFDDYVKEPDISFTIQNRVSEDNYFYITVERKHLQYNFDKNIMYGFFEEISLSVKVNGSQDKEKCWDIVRECVEIHNELNYKNQK